MLSKKQWDTVIHAFFTINGVSAIIILFAIFGFLTYTGISAFEKIPLTEFLFSPNWNPDAYEAKNQGWGILSMLVGSGYIAVGSMAFALPIGLAAAIYLSEIARPTVRELLKPAIEMIASLPSVVLGFLGIIFLAPLIAEVFGIPNGLNALTASILVGIMALPTIISISEDVLTAVPRDYRHASLALGATPWQTIRAVTVPAAAPGIAAAAMLGLGRVVGETMVVLMVAGNALAMPHSFLDPARPLTANIAIEIKEVVQGDLHFQALFAMGIVLFVITFAVNFAADLVIARATRNCR